MRFSVAGLRSVYCRTKLAAIAAVSLLFLSFAIPAAAEQKIGFVDMNRIEEEAPQLEALRKKFEREFAPRNKELVDKQRELKKLEDQLETDGPSMGSTSRTELEKSVLAKRRELKKITDEFREDLTIRRDEELSNLNHLVGNVIRDIARTKKFDLIFTAGVVYASDRIDITDMVLDELRAMKQ